jgi:hypothetical protein
MRAPDEPAPDRELTFFYIVVQPRDIAISPPNLHGEILRNEFSRFLLVPFSSVFFCFFVSPLLFEPAVTRNILQAIAYIALRLGP